MAAGGMGKYAATLREKREREQAQEQREERARTLRVFAEEGQFAARQGWPFDEARENVLEEGGPDAAAAFEVGYRNVSRSRDDG